VPFPVNFRRSPKAEQFGSLAWNDRYTFIIPIPAIFANPVYFRAVMVISMCAPAPASFVTPNVVRVGRGSLNTSI
jgi:hypothetical protein